MKLRPSFLLIAALRYARRPRAPGGVTQPRLLRLTVREIELLFGIEFFKRGTQ